MKNQQVQDHFPANPLMSSNEAATQRPSSKSVPISSSQSPSSSNDFPAFKSESGDPMIGHNKFGRKANIYALRIREHVKLGPKFSETLKSKLGLGAKIVRQGGRKNMFRHIFNVSDGEKLLKASQCYLSTTAGPIAGILFISTEKVAFCSERSIIISSPSGQFVKSPYKVLIPIKKINRANESENMNKPEHKYIEIVTEDNFEFWFMGFVRYEKAFMNLQKAISMSRSHGTM